MKRVKRILAIMILMAMMVNCLTAVTLKAEAVETGTCGDNIYWEISDWGNMYISGSGDMPDFSPDEPAPWAEYLPEGQLSVTISGDITSVGAYAFYGYPGALFVHMEDSAVMSIGEYAFYDCQNLNEIYFPESVMSIGSYAFYQCCSLTQLPQMELLVYIGDYAFYFCSSLATLPFGSSLTTIGEHAFEETYCLETMTIPASVTSIGAYAFSCSSIRTVTFEGNAPEIYPSTFSSSTLDAYYDPNTEGWDNVLSMTHYGNIGWYPMGGAESPVLGTGSCGGNLQWTLNQEGVLTISGTGRMDDYLATDLPWQSFTEQITSVVIEDGVEYIGREAFRDCTQISSITAGDSLQGVGMDAFNDTAWLSNQPNGLVFLGKVLLTYKGTCPAQVTIPEGTVGIGAKAFQDAGTLEQINFHANLKEIGAWAFEGCVNLKEIELNDGIVRLEQAAFSNCESITEIVVPDTVTAMGTGVFNSCGALESAVIGDGITNISEGTFYGCENLKQIIFGENVRSIGITAFYGCIALEKVELPATVSTIADSAFRGCTALKSIALPGVTKIGYYAFSGCRALEEVEFSDSLQELGECAFGYCMSLKSVTLPDSLKTMVADCFESCTSLEEVYVGKGIADFGRSAFVECTALKRIVVDPENPYYMNDECGVLYTKDQSVLLTYPAGRVGAYTVADTVAKIEQYAFAYSSGLTAITLPEELQSMGFGAFSDCTALTEVKLPDSLTKTYGGTFMECTALETVWFGSGLKRISATMFENCTALKNVHFADGLEEVRSSAFENCTSLTAIDLPDSVIEIADESFMGCTKLKTVDFPKNLQKISWKAFYECRSLEEVYLYDSVTSIGEEAFDMCTALEKVVLSKNLKYLNQDAFLLCTSLKVVVIHDAIQKIGSGAFSWCKALETVYYSGTQEQWNAITIENRNEELLNAEIHFEYCMHDTVENGICTNCGEEAILMATGSDGSVAGYYFSFADVPANGQKIILCKDTQVEDVVLDPGVELDLNGHTLSVNSILTYASSAVTDSSESNAGVLKILDAEGNMLSSGNSQLSVYDTEKGGYRFFEMKVTSVAVTGSSKYWFRVEAENFDLFNKLVQSGAEVYIQAIMIADGQEIRAVADLAFTQFWAQNSDKYITVYVQGAAETEDFSLTPSITSGGVEIFGEEM